MHIRITTLAAFAALSLAACGPKHQPTEPAAPPADQPGKQVIIVGPIGQPCCTTDVSTTPTARPLDPEPWYEGHPASVKTLGQAIAEEREFLSYHYVGASEERARWPNGNPYWHGHPADAKTCATLAKVHVTCDYNTRGTLTDFLAVNGKGLFPASSGTNPYYLPKDRQGDIESHRRLGYTHDPIDNGFVGQPLQNQMLAAAVRRNAGLFHHGDLAAADVKRSWR